MHPSDEHAPLWSLVRMLEHEQVEEWRKQHHPNLTLEGALTQHITEIQTEIKRRPGGTIFLTVSVLARRAFECEHFAYRLQRAGNRFWKVLQPGEPSTSE